MASYAAISRCAEARCGEDDDAAEREDAVCRAHLALREGDDLRIARAIGHRFPPAGDDDVAEEQDDPEQMQEFEQKIRVHTVLPDAHRRGQSRCFTRPAQGIE
jgi:hypothetical protein